MKNYYIFKSKEPQFNEIFLEFVLKIFFKSTFLPLIRAEKNYFQKSGRNFIFQHLRKILKGDKTSRQDLRQKNFARI